jgi:hypothetical protein
MNIKKILAKFIRNILNQDNTEPGQLAVKGKYSSSTGMGEAANGINFTIYSATGGKVVQFSTYDPIRDRHRSELYIIRDDEDLGEELGLIITKESLTR